MSNPYGGAPNGFNQQAYQFYQQPVQQFQQPQPMMAPVTPPCSRVSTLDPITSLWFSRITPQVGSSTTPRRSSPLRFL